MPSIKLAVLQLRLETAEITKYLPLKLFLNLASTIFAICRTKRPNMFPQSMKTRHYVYGDQDEDNPHNYFCTNCDLFAPAQHFEDEKHISNRVRRYTQSLQRWNNRAQEQRIHFYRPVEVKNIVADKVAADVEAEKSARSLFYRWLLRQTNRDDPIGDFANDVERDRQFPRTENSLDLIRSHLLYKNVAPKQSSLLMKLAGSSVQRAMFALVYRLPSVLPYSNETYIAAVSVE